jgi:hypothetical protein
MMNYGNYRRHDWQTAQVVDYMVDYLDQGGQPDLARLFMNSQRVMQSVQDRVLLRKAVVRTPAMR